MGDHALTENKDAELLLAFEHLSQCITCQKKADFRLVGGYSILFLKFICIFLHKEKFGSLNAKC